MAVEDQIIRPTQRPAVTSGVEIGNLPRHQIDSLDAAANVVARLVPGDDDAAEVMPFEAAVVADVAGGAGDEVVDAPPSLSPALHPTHSSWPNQVEGWFAILTNKQLKRGSHYSVQEFEAAIREFLEAHNGDPKPFRWVKTADEILGKLARLCRETVGGKQCFFN